jgi:hypothetical protein
MHLCHKCIIDFGEDGMKKIAAGMLLTFSALGYSATDFNCTFSDQQKNMVIVRRGTTDERFLLTSQNGNVPKVFSITEGHDTDGEEQLIDYGIGQGKTVKFGSQTFAASIIAPKGTSIARTADRNESAIYFRANLMHATGGGSADAVYDLNSGEMVFIGSHVEFCGRGLTDAN